MNNIAIVDGDESDLSNVQTILSPEYNVTLFRSFSTFKSAVAVSDRFDLVISDLNMNESGGREVIQLMSSIDVPVVILTDSTDKEIEVAWLKLGACDFIRKPIHNDILLYRVALQFRLVNQRHKIESAQSQLIQSEKFAALGQLAAGVAHEINNPIGFVNSNINLTKKYVAKIDEELNALERTFEQEEPGLGLLLFSSWKSTSQLPHYLENLADIVEESREGLDRVKDIIQNLKEYAHGSNEQYQAADLNKILRSAVNLLRNEIKYKADVVFKLGDLPRVDCIVSQISQVLINIIVNACHAIDAFGQITLETQSGNGVVKIFIRDTGRGISPEALSKIFDPFYTTKPVGEGTGIGLAISKSIIERHNGSIKVSSIVGAGTCFELTLPVEGQTIPESKDTES